MRRSWIRRPYMCNCLRDEMCHMDTWHKLPLDDGGEITVDVFKCEGCHGLRFFPEEDYQDFLHYGMEPARRETEQDAVELAYTAMDTYYSEAKSALKLMFMTGIGIMVLGYIVYVKNGLRLSFMWMSIASAACVAAAVIWYWHKHRRRSR